MAEYTIDGTPVSSEECEHENCKAELTLERARKILLEIRACDEECCLCKEPIATTKVKLKHGGSDRWYISLKEIQPEVTLVLWLTRTNDGRNIHVRVHNKCAALVFPSFYEKLPSE